MWALEYKHFMASFLCLRKEENRIQTTTCINQFWKWDLVLNLHVNIYEVACYSSEELYELVWKQTTAETETVAHCGEHGIAALVQSISTPPTVTSVLHVLLLMWVYAGQGISVPWEIPPSPWEKFLSLLRICCYWWCSRRRGMEHFWVQLLSYTQFEEKQK